MNYSDPNKLRDHHRALRRLSGKSVKFITEEMEGIKRAMIGTTGMATPWMIETAISAHKQVLNNRKK